MGKGVYHFAIPDLSGNLEGEPISICEVKPEYRNGVSGFDYERIRAEESLEREMEKYVLFAVNNFARAVTPEEEREKYFEMRIPANMYIWATMNSADQGVFPMDTAFKRRWEFEYLSVNDDEQVAAIKDYVIPMCIKDNKADHYIGWDSLRTRINNILTSEKCKVNEDKLLGPFFISKNMLDEIKNNKEQVDELEAKDEASRTEKDNEALKDMHQKENSYIKAFESKVIMYLFEDVMKMRPENIFIGHNKKNGKMIFSEICKAFEQDGEGIFGIEDLVNI